MPDFSMMPEAFVSSAELATAVSREVKAGRLRKLGSRLYTRNLKDPPEKIVQRNLWLSISFPKHVALALNGGSALPLKGRCPVSVTVTPQQITQQAATTVSCR